MDYAAHEVCAYFANSEKEIITIEEDNDENDPDAASDILLPDLLEVLKNIENLTYDN